LEADRWLFWNSRTEAEAFGSNNGSSNLHFNRSGKGYLSSFHWNFITAEMTTG
jgi:hypothetical protein